MNKRKDAETYLLILTFSGYGGIRSGDVSSPCPPSVGKWERAEATCRVVWMTGTDQVKLLMQCTSECWWRLVCCAFCHHERTSVYLHTWYSMPSTAEGRKKIRCTVETN